MTKIVINKRHGGFGLSPKAEKRYLELIGKDCYFYTRVKWGFENNGVYEYKRISMDEAKDEFISYTYTRDLGEIVNEFPDDGSSWYDGNLERTDPILIQVVSELGKEADGEYAELSIVEIPDDVEWEIDEYDGWETIHEKHRTWG